MLTITTPKVTTNTDGATLAFDFEFDMSMADVDDELAVVFNEGETDEATLALNTDYTLSAPNNNYKDGGTVTLVTGSAYAANGNTITIKSALLRKSEYTMQHGGQFNPFTFLIQDKRVHRMVQEIELNGGIEQTAITAFYKTQLTKPTAKAARETLQIYPVIVCHKNQIVCHKNRIVYHA